MGEVQLKFNTRLFFYKKVSYFSSTRDFQQLKADFLNFVLKNVGFVVVLSYKPLSYKRMSVYYINNSGPRMAVVAIEKIVTYDLMIKQISPGIVVLVDINLIRFLTLTDGCKDINYGCKGTNIFFHPFFRKKTFPFFSNNNKTTLFYFILTLDKPDIVE